jgi:hypothetical protein
MKKTREKWPWKWLRHIYTRQTYSSSKTHDAETDADFYIREA